MTEAWIKEFVECFDSVDKQGLFIEKGYMLKHQHLPMCIYKFRAVNAYSLNNLDEWTIWLTSLSKYNDPYDCAATMSYSDIAKATPRAQLESSIRSSNLQSVLSSDEIEEALNASEPLMAIARKVLAKDQSLPRDKIDEMVKALKDAQDHVMAPLMEKLVDSVRDGIKMCSFCAAFESILMWSHYANNHQGFCMEYKVAGLPDIVKRMLFPVIYNSSLFDCTKYYAKAISSPEGFNNIYASLQALYKSPEWSYEKEWRLVFIAGVIKDEMNYPIGHPHRVYLGAKMSDSDRAKVLDICRARKLEARAMKLVPNSFKLTFDPIP